MEKHFLEGRMEGKPQFRPEPWYNPDGDCITCQVADEAVVAERVDDLLTVYRSALDNRPIGFQIKGVQAIIRKFGWDGLAVASETDTEGLRSISIAVLLLAAYEAGPMTLGRRKAYAGVMESPPPRCTLSADELAPA